MPSLISRSYSARSGSWLSSTLTPGGVSAGAARRALATMPVARSVSAAGGPVDRVGSGQAELGRPALGVRPRVVPLVQVGLAGVGGKGHGGDGAVAVQGPAGC